ncbi:cupin domain-containing protein [Kordia sp.]|uniref:cupin domain-containing protein n=1 Tax=Kordia sp. TaxID=1965332 RepID=UPI003D2AAB7B
MNRFHLLLFLLISVQCLYAQKATTDSILKPFKISERYLSGLDIPKVTLKAHPERAYFQKRIYKGSDLSIFILSSETATNTIANFPIDEFVYYLKGKAEITTKNDQKITFLSGDYICVPKGFSGTWINNGGNTYHLELSVISNKRAAKETISTPNIPFLLNRELLSGIENSSKETSLFSGVELNMKTVSEKAGLKEISKTNTDQFIHVLDGIVTIIPKNGASETYLRGDFFILPKGFSGSWKTEAQDTFRMLLVTSK